MATPTSPRHRLTNCKRRCQNAKSTNAREYNHWRLASTFSFDQIMLEQFVCQLTAGNYNHHFGTVDNYNYNFAPIVIMMIIIASGGKDELRGSVGHSITHLKTRCSKGPTIKNNQKDNQQKNEFHSVLPAIMG